MLDTRCARAMYVAKAVDIRIECPRREPRASDACGYIDRQSNWKTSRPTPHSVRFALPWWGWVILAAYMRNITRKTRMLNWSRSWTPLPRPQTRSVGNSDARRFTTIAL